MSWPQWSQVPAAPVPIGVPPVPPPVPAPVQSAAPPSTMAYTPAVQAPTTYTPAQYAALTPEQQYAMQQNWQQWQTYHQQYAQWHAQYGEQYQREMQAKLGATAPQIPFVSNAPSFTPSVQSNLYGVPPPPPDSIANSVLATPSASNIMAAASQPPPPPPPLEEVKPTNEIEKSGTLGNYTQDKITGRGDFQSGGADRQEFGRQNFERQNQNPSNYDRQSFDGKNRDRQNYDMQNSDRQNFDRQRFSDQANQNRQFENRGRDFNDRRNLGGNDQDRRSFGERNNERGGSFNDRGGNFNDRGGNYNDRGGNFNDRVGNFNDRGGNFNERGSNFNDRGGNFNDRGGNFNDRGGNFNDRDGNRSGNFNVRGGNFNDRSNFNERGNFNNDRSNINDRNDRINLNDRSQTPWQQTKSNIPETNVGPNEQNRNIQSYIDGPDDGKTPEERTFDEQFRKWEEEFERWKKQNANHPDKTAYREYEMKFEDCRRKLLERREQMRLRKIAQQVKKNDDVVVPSKEKEPEEVKKDDITVIPIEEIDDETSNDDVQEITKEDVKVVEKPAEVLEFLKSTKSDGIPGLDLVPVQEEPPEEPAAANAEEEITEIIDLEEDKHEIPSQTRNVPLTKEIPSLLSQKFEPPSFSPPGNNRRDDNFNRFRNRQSFENFPGDRDLRNNPENLNQSMSPITGKNNTTKNFNDSNTFSDSGDTGNTDQQVPPGIAQLATALSDPNVLALLTAALGNSNQSNFQDGGGSSRMSPWASNPFQNRNVGGGPQGMNNSNFNQKSNIWQDNRLDNRQDNRHDNRRNSNSPWSNNSNNQMMDNRMNHRSPWQNKNNNNSNNFNNSGGRFNNRSNNNNNDGRSNWRNDNDQKDDTDEPQPLVAQDEDLRQNPFRNSMGPDEVRERSHSSEPKSDKFNPFKNERDRDDRKRFNPFKSENERPNVIPRLDIDRMERSTSRDKTSGDNNSRDRSRSSSRQNDQLGLGRRFNPFKANDEQMDATVNVSLKSPIKSLLNTSIIDASEVDAEPKTILPEIVQNESPVKDDGDEYYRPAQVIDYQNKSIGGKNDVGGSHIAKKVVDYGHRPSNRQEDNFFPMKTIEYGHSSSARNDMRDDDDKPWMRGPDGNRNQNRNRRRNNNNSRWSGLEDNNIGYGQNSWNQPNMNYQQQQQQGFNMQQNYGIRPLMNDVGNFMTPPLFNVGNNNFQESHFNQFGHENGDSRDENLEEISDDDNNDFADSIKNKPSKSMDEVPAAVILNNPSNDIKPERLFPIEEMNIFKKIPEKSVPIIFPSMANSNTIRIDEILLKPGRDSRPKKIVIILRGPPGSGKTYVAKLIKEKEVEMGGSAPRLLSIDDYFMSEIDKEEKCPKTGRKIITKEMLYEYEKDMEESYQQYLMKSYKKTINDHLFDFIIVDSVNNTLRTFTEFYNVAKGFQFTPYTIDLKCDVETCLSNNIHNRSEEDIKNILENWSPTPDHYIKLDITSLLQSAAIPEVEMEDISDVEDEPIADDKDVIDIQEETEAFGFLKSKWDDQSDDKLARLDGINKPLHKSATLEDYLQIDGWEPPSYSKNSKKRVRWADIEEKRAQDKMRAIGFVVGQTDWNRMMDPTSGSSALTKTKFIEKIKR